MPFADKLPTPTESAERYLDFVERAVAVNREFNQRVAGEARGRRPHRRNVVEHGLRTVDEAVAESVASTATVATAPVKKATAKKAPAKKATAKKAAAKKATAKKADRQEGRREAAPAGSTSTTSS